MSTVSPFAERVHDVFARPRDVLGLVAELLTLCHEQDLRLDWHNGRCQVRLCAPSPVESVEVAIPESVFRAVLARIAGLCNERSADSVSPYGGEGWLATDANGATTCQVAFSNRPGELWVTMSRSEL